MHLPIARNKIHMNKVILSLIVALFSCIFIRCNSVSNVTPETSKLPVDVLGFSGSFFGKDTLIISKTNNWKHAASKFDFGFNSFGKDSIRGFAVSINHNKYLPNCDSSHNYLKKYLSVGKKEFYSPSNNPIGFRFLVSISKVNSPISLLGTTSFGNQSSSIVEVIKLEEKNIVSSNNYIKVACEGKKYLILDLKINLNINDNSGKFLGNINGYMRTAYSPCCEDFINLL